MRFKKYICVKIHYACLPRPLYLIVWKGNDRYSHSKGSRLETSSLEAIVNLKFLMLCRYWQVRLVNISIYLEKTMMDICQFLQTRWYKLNSFARNDIHYVPVLLTLKDFACWVIFHEFLSVVDFRNTIRVSNSLDPDQVRRFVGLHLDPICLQRQSADYTSRQRVKAISLYR